MRPELLNENDVFPKKPLLFRTFLFNLQRALISHHRFPTGAFEGSVKEWFGKGMQIAS
jgi:hypothetical protein